MGGWEVWEWGRQILALQEGLAPKGPQANPLLGVEGCPWGLASHCCQKCLGPHLGTGSGPVLATGGHVTESVAPASGHWQPHLDRKSRC